MPIKTKAISVIKSNKIKTYFSNIQSIAWIKFHNYIISSMADDVVGDSDRVEMVMAIRWLPI